MLITRKCPQCLLGIFNSNIDGINILTFQYLTSNTKYIKTEKLACTYVCTYTVGM